ncbi:M12 family metallopeptidase [Pseudomonas purpurea]|uniref:M12 family metallopeptidase n=1 Tax=Pseudomonas purpurea TaxID=3136737 RepID=UPI003263FAB6
MNTLELCTLKKAADIQASYDAAITENPDNRGVPSKRQKRAVAKHLKFWAPGRTLRIAFLDGDQLFKDAVKVAAQRWLPHINLKFEFVEGSEAEIRITSKSGYWSYIGTDALTVPEQDEATMSLSPDHHISLTFFTANTIHEFGHALGAEHEHLHPEVTIPWNKEAVYKAHGAEHEDNYYARSVVDKRFFNLLDASEVNYSPYDPQSIMHYAIRQEWTEGDFKIDLNLVLSEGDKAFMAKAYPYPESQSK